MRLRYYARMRQPISGVRAYSWAEGAIECIRSTLGQSVLAARIPGEGYTAFLRLDRAEHERRRVLGVSAMTSTALLASLWELPSGGATPAHVLSNSAVTRLREASYAASESGDGFKRTYAPIGTVEAVAFSGRQPCEVVRRAVSFTPVVRRYAIVRPSRVIAEATEFASRSGIGLIVQQDPAAILFNALAAEVGRPHVYRWWLAELAYAHVNYEYTQRFS
jgi:hypothetical protein